MLDTREETRSIWDELATGLGSGRKFRIPIHMALHPKEPFTRYTLSRVTGIRDTTIERQMGILIRLGWVEAFPFVLVTYRLNTKKGVVKRLLELASEIKDVRGEKEYGRNLRVRDN